MKKEKQENVIIMPQPKRWLRPDDLAEEFGISKNTQATLRSAAKIPYSKRGSLIFYDRTKIDAWLEDAVIIGL